MPTSAPFHEASLALSRFSQSRLSRDIKIDFHSIFSLTIDFHAIFSLKIDFHAIFSLKIYFHSIFSLTIDFRTIFSHFSSSYLSTVFSLQRLCAPLNLSHGLFCFLQGFAERVCHASGFSQIYNS